MPKIKIEFTQSTDVPKFVQVLHMNTDIVKGSIEMLAQELTTQGVVTIPLEIEFNINGLLKGLSTAKVEVSFSE
ncbi:hypothetical protein BOO29_18795 [Vibrio navarrensis]|uniref:Uncharacterized protein n=2 Tax=Gammaproteobacteria TaxID=1236 RepID=A0A099LYL3_9VIBR|nr:MULTISPECIES: hypothetical protein [Gammaproteobacteria]HBU8768893.1 hypothetical protein [Klebsiella pneumoniae]EIV0337225.1 hypothetical protein [Vibrio cholerae]EJK2117053.1 hypothetical protein [Vibrio navarrensis]ELJ8714149.1 hypothetical protein [Vibrio cholerae]KGK12436.1 hypothetical protein EA26_14440 [Vibrio navarrensis]